MPETPTEGTRIVDLQQDLRKYQASFRRVVLMVDEEEELWKKRIQLRQIDRTIIVPGRCSIFYVRNGLI